MSWEDFISHVLTTSSKVDKIAILDSKGNPVAVTEDTEINQSEGQAIINCLTDPAKTLTKLHIDNEMYLCVQGIGHTFIGTSVKTSKRVIVAREAEDHVIVLFGEAAGKGSFIFELKESLLLKAQGRLIGQEHLEQQRQLLPIDPIDVGGAIDSQQVLVDLA